MPPSMALYLPPKGQLEVRWSHTPDRRLTLLWTETGGPPVKAPTRHGFGGKVIKNMIEQLKGQTRFDWRPFAKSVFRRENRPFRAPRSPDLHRRRGLTYYTSPYCGA